MALFYLILPPGRLLAAVKHKCAVFTPRCQKISPAYTFLSSIKCCWPGRQGALFLAPFGYAESQSRRVKGNVMMILKDKEHVDSVDWQTVAEIIAAAGLNQRDVALVERAFRHSTFCWFGYENGQLIAVARAISDLT